MLNEYYETSGKKINPLWTRNTWRFLGYDTERKVTESSECLQHHLTGKLKQPNAGQSLLYPHNAELWEIKADHQQPANSKAPCSVKKLEQRLRGDIHAHSWTHHRFGNYKWWNVVGKRIALDAAGGVQSMNIHEPKLTKRHLDRKVTVVF